MATRMTHQREIMLAEIQKRPQHVSADELFQMVREQMPKVSLATVYRTLEFLADAGVIARLKVSGRQKRYDSEVHVHDHVFCVQCQKVENVVLRKSEDKEDLEKDFPLPATVDGFVITGRRLEFIGLCPACQKKNQQQKGAAIMGCGCKSKTTGLSEDQKKVLEAMAKHGAPCASKDIASATGLDAKVVSCKLTDLKKKGLVDSPERCRYGLTEEGRVAMKG